MEVLSAIQGRHSSRAFLERPVDREIIAELLATASRAPSAINLQPWAFTVVSGPERLRLSRALEKAFREKGVGCGSGASQPLPPYLQERQYSSFIGLAEHLEADAPTVRQFINQGSLNFYGAPTAIIITKENTLPASYLASVGIMIGYLLLAAEDRGLATCPIGLIKAYEETVLDFLNIENRELVLGLALGFADSEAPVNRLRVPRENPATLIRWYG